VPASRGNALGLFRPAPKLVVVGETRRRLTLMYGDVQIRRETRDLRKQNLVPLRQRARRYNNRFSNATTFRLQYEQKSFVKRGKLGLDTRDPRSPLFGPANVDFFVPTYYPTAAVWEQTRIYRQDQNLAPGRFYPAQAQGRQAAPAGISLS